MQSNRSRKENSYSTRNPALKSQQSRQSADTTVFNRITKAARGNVRDMSSSKKSSSKKIKMTSFSQALSSIDQVPAS